MNQRISSQSSRTSLAVLRYRAIALEHACNPINPQRLAIGYGTSPRLDILLMIQPLPNSTIISLTNELYIIDVWTISFHGQAILKPGVLPLSPSLHLLMRNIQNRIKLPRIFLHMPAAISIAGTCLLAHANNGRCTWIHWSFCWRFSPFCTINFSDLVLDTFFRSQWGQKTDLSNSRSILNRKWLSRR